MDGNDSRKKMQEPDFEALASMKSTSKASRLTTAVLLLLCIILTAAVLVKMFSAPPAEEALAADNNVLAAVNVSAAPAEYGTFVKISRMNGEIRRASNDIIIYPEISSTGMVTDVLIDEGDTINRGDIVAYIDSSRPGSIYKISPVIAKTGGIVLDVNVSEGERISSSTAIATITNNDDLVIRASIPEKFIGTLRKGMTAEFETVAYPGRMYTAALSYIAPSVDTTSRTTDIELTITGNTEGLMSGMYIKLNLETEHQDDVLMVPASAVDEYLGDDVVFIVDNGSARRQVVTTGSTNNSETVILSGLSEGELVITAGNVTDGTAISVV